MTRGVVFLVLSLAAAPEAASGEEAPHPVGAAPIPEDLEAMRSTLRAFEAAVASRDAEAVEPLLARALPRRRRGELRHRVRDAVQALPPGADYFLRTDIGPGALVPSGPDRVRVQTTQEVRVGESAQSDAMHFELAAEEESGRRLWLIVDLAFPEERGHPVPGLSHSWWWLAVPAGC